MRGAESSSALELEDDEMDEMFEAADGLEPAAELRSEAEVAVDPDVAVEPDVEVDDDLLEPDFGKTGHSRGNYLQDDEELEALIDLDCTDDTEDELEMAFLQELGIEIGDDAGTSMITLDGEGADADSFDDEVAA